MDLDTWAETVPKSVRESSLRRVRACQFGLYLTAMAMRDAEVAMRDPRLGESTPQLVKSAGSIPANVSEGYSRRSRSDRIRFYEYALGSANETQSWYLGAIDVLGEDQTTPRLEYLTRVRQLLLVMIRNERNGTTWGSGRPIPKPPSNQPGPQRTS